MNSERQIARQLLSEVLEMVRYGLYQDVGTLRQWRQEVAERIQRLSTLLLVMPCLLDAIDTVQLVSLRTEFHDILGEDQKAAKVLNEFMQQPSQPASTPDRAAPNRLNAYILPTIDGLVQRVIKVPGEPPIGGLGTLNMSDECAKWMRQVAWLHMEYAWVCLYRRGEYQAALHYLDNVLKFLQHHDLISATRPSHGTRCRYFYYRGHCERSLRLFSASLHSFTQSQFHAKQRYLQKKKALLHECQDAKARMKRLAPERRFAVICSAHILGGGIAWNGIHQGHLLHAQEACLSAETLLIDTGQEPLRAFIESNGLIARRRAADASTKEAKEAMSGLIRCFFRYQQVGDYLGQLRCGLEFIRGHYDFVAYWNPASRERERSIKAMRRWLQRLDGIVQCTVDPAWEFRVKLLRLRVDLLADASADSSRLITAARSWASEPRDAPLIAEQQVVCALIHAKAGDYNDALSALGRALHQTREQDPVIEAECYLQMAHVHLQMGDYAAVQEDLVGWRRLERLVENAYLHRFAKIIDKDLNYNLQPFVIRVDDENLGWDRCERELRAWLSKAARRRAGPHATGKEIARILGVNASSWSRWTKASE